MNNLLKNLMQDRHFIKNQIKEILNQKPEKQVLNIIIESQGKYLHF